MLRKSIFSGFRCHCLLTVVFQPLYNEAIDAAAVNSKLIANHNANLNTNPDSNIEDMLVTCRVWLLHNYFVARVLIVSVSISQRWGV